MAYQINKTDGTIVATVADGQVDQLSTDLTLIGKNYSGFGEALNENFIKLLENFASTTRPTHPVRGQIWFDVAELKLKVYSGTGFQPVSSATISNTQPSNLGVGDLWFNDVDRQLYFFDGTNTILLAPAYSASQGVSGLRVASILDTLNQTRVVTYFYNNGILLGIFAKDTFTPKNAIDGFTGSIVPGFNAGNLAGIKFNVTCTNADQLGGTTATTYVRKDTSNAIAGQLRITTDLGLVVGSAGQANLTVNNGNIFLSNAATDKNMIFNVRKGINQEDAITIYADTREVKIYDGYTDSVVTLGGGLVITGDLTVQGTTTTVNTATVSVEDKNIELARNAVDNSDADGGGITLNGGSDPDKTLIWTTASSAWNSSEHMNLASGKSYRINGIEVLTANSLGVGITSIPGVTSFGKQTVINVGPGLVGDPAYLRLQNNKISTLITNQDLELEPQGTGNVALIGSPKITGLADPTAAQDAATKEYVDDTIEMRSIVLSMDLSDGKPNSYIITNILNNIAPVADYRDGTVARILCTILSNSTVNLDVNPLINQSSSTFNTPTGTAPALTNVSISVATVPAPSVSTTRIIKVFQVIAGAWNHVSDTVLPP
jgi:hypothetical protein